MFGTLVYSTGHRYEVVQTGADPTVPSEKHLAGPATAGTVFLHIVPDKVVPAAQVYVTVVGAVVETVETVEVPLVVVATTDVSVSTVDVDVIIVTVVVVLVVVFVWKTQLLPYRLYDPFALAGTVGHV